MVDLVVFSQRLDRMTLEVFFSPNDSMFEGRGTLVNSGSNLDPSESVEALPLSSREPKM